MLGISSHGGSCRTGKAEKSNEAPPEGASPLVIAEFELRVTRRHVFPLPPKSRLLEALRSWSVSRGVLTELQAMPEWKDARTWDWVLESGELTGTAQRHAVWILDGSSVNDTRVLTVG